MSKTLMITDKRAIADTLSVLMNVDKPHQDAGYCEDENYIIFCSDGDLMEVSAIDEYVSGEITADLLPILPERIRYKVLPEKETRVHEIKYLFTRTDIGKIIIATESTHIGEVRAATIFLACGMDPYGENIYRLWTSKPLVPENVDTEIENAKPSREFKDIYEVSQAQIITDWLFTENISKALSLALKTRHRITRPQAYVLSLLAINREERALFRSNKYWVVKARFSSVSKAELPWPAEYQGEKFKKGEDADKFAKKIKGEKGKVRIQKSKKRQKMAPKLLNLADLQAEAQKRYNFNAEETLVAALSCHNTLKCISSPLTSANLLPESEIRSLQKAVEILQAEYSDFFTQMDQRRISIRNSKLFTSKIADRHHAIIPIAPLPENAGEKETTVYGIILKRFAATVSAPSDYTDIETEVTILDQVFKGAESVLKKPGWQYLFGKTHSERQMPDLPEGHQVKVVDTEACERKTTPPPELTDGSLIRLLAAPARKIKDIRNDVFTIRPQDISISTKSVRGQIIEELIKDGYVQRTKKKLSLTDKGLFLIDTISRLPATSRLLSHKEVAKWEMRLSNIAKRTLLKAQFIDEVKTSIAAAVKQCSPGTFEKLTSKKLNGNCPLCGGNIYEKTEFYGCSNWKEPLECKFRIWRRYGGRIIGKKYAEQLVNNKRTELISGFVSNDLKKREFSAYLVLKIDGNKNVRITYDFPKEKAIDEVGPCPDCGGTVYEYQTRYTCGNVRDGKGCKFQMWKTMNSRTIETEQVRQLLTEGRTGKLFGFVSRKRGYPKKYAAALSLKKGSPTKVIFDFEHA